MIVTVPAALPVTVPAASTVATLAFEDVKVNLGFSLAPVAATLVVLPASMLVTLALTVKFWAAFAILKSTEAVPSQFVTPEIVNVAFPALILFW